MIGAGAVVTRDVPQGAGFNGLIEGAKVDFDVVDNRGKPAAENLRVK